MKKKLTQERLRELLHYDPDTGIWTWVVSRTGKANAGAVAGCINAGGYRQIKIGNIPYRSARLAHLYMTGEMPIALMDHINGARDDDRWCNLRNATHLENIWNRRALGHNKTGIKGVWQRPGRKQYVAMIRKNGRQECLGAFATIEEGAAAYAVAAAELHGEFAFSNRGAA